MKIFLLMCLTLVLVGCSRGGDEAEANGYEPLNGYDAGDYENGENGQGDFGTAEDIYVPSPFADTIAMATEMANDRLREHSIAGLSVAVVDADTGFTWAQGFGFGDRQFFVPVNEHTIFPLGSVSKTFTAVAVMQLVELGLLDLDVPVVYYLPDFYVPPSATGGDFRNITPRMLLTHTSGILPGFLGYGLMTIGENNPDYMNYLLVRLANYFMFAPEDEVFNYANKGYDILGILVAHLTGGSDNFFDDFVSYTSENIFARAGMTRSTFDICDELLPYMAMPYIDAPRRDTFVYYNGIATGGVFSTAYDMARFMHILLGGGGDLLGESGVEQMFAVHDFDFSLSFQTIEFGLGIMHHVNADGAAVAGHGGTLIHYHTDMVFCLEHRIGVFVTTNSIVGRSVVPELSQAILAAAVTEKAGGQTLLEPRADAAAMAISLDVERLESYVGVYVGPMEYLLVRLNGEELELILPALPAVNPFALIPMSDGSFYSALGRMWFDRVQDEMVLKMGDLGIHIVAIKINADYLKPTDAFLAFYGIFAPVQALDNLSNTAMFRYGVDAFGFAFVQNTTLNGLSPTVAVRTDNDSWKIGIEGIEYDENGMVVAYTALGMRFERVE